MNVECENQTVKEQETGITSDLSTFSFMSTRSSGGTSKGSLQSLAAHKLLCLNNVIINNILYR